MSTQKPQSTLTPEEVEQEANEYAEIQQAEIAATDDYNAMAHEDEESLEEMRLLQLETEAFGKWVNQSEFRAIEAAEQKYQEQEDLSEETRLLQLEKNAEEARQRLKLK